MATLESAVAARDAFREREKFDEILLETEFCIGGVELPIGSVSSSSSEAGESAGNLSNLADGMGMN